MSGHSLVYIVHSTPDYRNEIQMEYHKVHSKENGLTGIYASFRWLLFAFCHELVGESVFPEGFQFL